MHPGPRQSVSGQCGNTRGRCKGRPASLHGLDLLLGVFSSAKRCKKKYCSMFWLYLINSVQSLTN
jgi:hypothetical protein